MLQPVPGCAQIRLLDTMPAGPQLLLRVHANALIFAVISCAEIGAAVLGTLDNQMIQGGETGPHYPAVHSPTTAVLQDAPDASVFAKASISAASALLSKSTWRAAFQWQEFAWAPDQNVSQLASFHSSLG